MTKDTSFKDTVLFILGAFLASFVVLVFLYPDLWGRHTSRLLPSHDTVIPLESTFILVSHFFHGGIQLWDRFDQMNNAYFVLANGIYSVVNILTAFIVIILSPFSVHQGEDLYYIHLIFFYSLNCLVRTIGGYVLLRKLVSHRGAIFIALVYLNTILTSYMMTPGIITQSLYSLLPLLLYFILCFFEELRLRSFLLAVLMMALCLVSTPLFTLGYFYQAVHFFILSCVIFFVFDRGWRKLKGRQSPVSREIFKNMGLLACGVLIILPYFWWGHSLMYDFYVHGSGLGETQGRFNNFFNLSRYFNPQGKSFANPLDFLGTSLDYHHMWWGESWLFIGASSLFLALGGLVLSQDRRKYIFAATIFFVISINTPCFPGNFFALGQYLTNAAQHPAEFWARGIQWNEWMLYVWLMVSSVIHGINALTNPFSFLVRSFHMTSLLISMLMLPLVAMGLESYFYLWQRKTQAIHFNRRWFLMVFHAFVLVWALLGGVKTLGIYLADQNAVQNVKEYLLSIGTIFFLFILMPEIVAADKRWVKWIILGLALAVEFVALKSYGQWGVLANIAPVRISPCYTHQAIIPDYQNPTLLAFREFPNVEKGRFYPEIHAPSEMYGAFYQYIPMGRFFHPWDIYEPRPLIYKDLYPDFEIQQYLSSHQRSIFFADYAFDSRYIHLADILRLNLGARVVMVEAQQYNRPFLKTAERVYVTPTDVKEKFYNVSLDWKQARVCKSPAGWEYAFDLPKDFPSYLSTTVFTDDYNSWELTVNGRLLEPMQGQLTSPYTYDVQNIQARKITVLWPDAKPPQADIQLQVKLPERILGVWKNTYDDLGLTYEAPKAGWLVFNYPYDEKWELTIDGQKTPISKVNRYFIGAPISAGPHQILLRYWPHTSLRFWIFVSMALSTVCFLAIMLYSIKRGGLYRGE